MYLIKKTTHGKKFNRQSLFYEFSYCTKEDALFDMIKIAELEVKCRNIRFFNEKELLGIIRHDDRYRVIVDKEKYKVYLVDGNFIFCEYSIEIKKGV